MKRSYAIEKINYVNEVEELLKTGQSQRFYKAILNKLPLSKELVHFLENENEFETVSHLSIKEIEHLPFEKRTLTALKLMIESKSKDTKAIYLLFNLSLFEALSRQKEEEIKEVLLLSKALYQQDRKLAVSVFSSFLPIDISIFELYENELANVLYNNPDLLKNEWKKVRLTLKNVPLSKWKQIDLLEEKEKVIFYHHFYFFNQGRVGQFFALKINKKIRVKKIRQHEKTFDKIFTEEYFEKIKSFSSTVNQQYFLFFSSYSYAQGFKKTLWIEKSENMQKQLAKQAIGNHFDLLEDNLLADSKKTNQLMLLSNSGQNLMNCFYYLISFLDREEKRKWREKFFEHFKASIRGQFKKEGQRYNVKWLQLSTVSIFLCLWKTVDKFAYFKAMRALIDSVLYQYSYSDFKNKIYNKANFANSLYYVKKILDISDEERVLLVKFYIKEKIKRLKKNGRVDLAIKLFDEAHSLKGVMKNEGSGIFKTEDFIEIAAKAWYRKIDIEQKYFNRLIEFFKRNVKKKKAVYENSHLGEKQYNISYLFENLKEDVEEELREKILLQIIFNKIYKRNRELCGGAFV